MGSTSRVARVLAVSALVLVATAASAARQEEAFERTVPFKATDRLVVDNENGSVTVESWDRNEVQIRATKYADSREALAELKIEVNTTPGVVDVRTITPRRSDSGFWSWIKGNDGNCGVTYTITVPRAANLDLETVNGRVAVRGVSGDMSLESTNGRIEVLDSAGRVDASTTNGRIHAQLRSVSPGGMRFSTTNGGVEVELPDTISANLDVSTTNGKIGTDFPVTVQGSFSKNHFSGEVNGGGDSIRIRTTNGSVNIRKFGD